MTYLLFLEKRKHFFLSISKLTSTFSIIYKLKIKVIWKKTINIDEHIVELNILENDDPAMTILNALQPYGISYSDRKRIMNMAKEDGVYFPTEHALVWSQDITLDEEMKFNGTIHFYDDGSEPVDVIDRFTKEHKLEIFFQQITESVLPLVCPLVVCQRNIPAIWSKEITQADDTEPIGTLTVLKGNEPIDVLHEFSQQHNLSPAFQQEIFDLMCEDVVCKRNITAVFRKDVNDQHGQILGTVEILEGEEVSDGIWRFLVSLGALGTTIDIVALKNFVFQNACGQSERIKCTRTVAHVYDEYIRWNDGTEVERLIITEFEEPADKVYRFCQDHGLEKEYSKMLEQACGQDMVVCNRKEPVVFSMQITDPDGGIIGTLSIKKDEEVIDALYAFFAKHYLFNRGWQMSSVWDQVCKKVNRKEASCKREKAVKFVNSNYSIGEVNVGPIIVWEDMEVVDLLFKLRMKFNFTVQDQVSWVCEFY